MRQSEKIADTLLKLAGDPKRLALAITILKDPDKARDALTYQISRETDPGQLKWLQSMRDKLELYWPDLRREKR